MWRLLNAFCIIFLLEIGFAQQKDKAFSLFNVITFKNEPCQSSSTTPSSGPRNGTCYTNDECAEKGGQSAGSCAAGFGTCCVFATSKCGSDIVHNSSYVRNEGFPSSINGAHSCMFTIKKCDAQVCTIRLDFESFNLLAGTGTTDALGDCQDKFTIGGLSTKTAPTPTICGSNAGQHIYVELGTGESDSAELNFEFAAVVGNRNFEMKVTQIICNSNARPPEGCLQWHTGTEGRIETFNFAGNNQHLNDQQYNICIRQEMGFCCIEYTVCSDLNSWSLFTMSDGMGGMETPLIESSCTTDWVEIEGSNEMCALNRVNNRYCGHVLADTPTADPILSTKICDCTQPFTVGIKTNSAMYPDPADATMMIADMGGLVPERGVCLDYFQTPCGQSRP